MQTRLEQVISAWAIAGGIVLLVIVGVTAFNVSAYVAGSLARLWGGTVGVFAGYEDFIRYTVGAAALMLFPYCELRGGHVSVDVVFDRLPRWLQRGAGNLARIGQLALVLFLFYWIAHGMMDARADGLQSPVLAWAEWPFYLPGLMSLVLWAIAVALNAMSFHRGGGGRRG